MRGLSSYTHGSSAVLEVRPLLKREVSGLTIDAFNAAIKEWLPLDLARNCNVGQERFTITRQGPADGQEVENMGLSLASNAGACDFTLEISHEVRMCIRYICVTYGMICHHVTHLLLCCRRAKTWTTCRRRC